MEMFKFLGQEDDKVREYLKKIKREHKNLRKLKKVKKKRKTKTDSGSKTTFLSHNTQCIYIFLDLPYIRHRSFKSKVCRHFFEYERQIEVKTMKSI